MSRLPKAGDIFASRYELLNLLGQGGGGAVFKARQIDSDRLIALKILHPELNTNEEFKTRFLREAKALSRTNHPNIVRVYHCGFGDNDLAYVAMEFVDGINVRKLLFDNKFLPSLRVLHIVKQTAEALAHAHEEGIIHRDIKPENIILVDAPEPDTVKLIDFGLARFSDERTITAPGALLGTFDYISPEQASGKKADQKSDIYSLCACLYEMLSGVKPFSADNPIGVISKHIHEAVPPLQPNQIDRFHPDINKLLLKGLAKEPEQRFADMKELSLALSELNETLTSIAASTPSQNQSKLTAGLSPRFMPIMAVLLGAILVALGAMYYSRLQTQQLLKTTAVGASKPTLRKTARISKLQAIQIETLALNANKREALVQLNEYLDSKRLDTKARAILLEDKASVLGRSAPEALLCAQQAFVLTENDYSHYKEDLSKRFYISCAFFYLESLLAAQQYRDASSIARQMIPVTLSLSDGHPWEYSVYIRTVTVGELRVSAATAAIGLHDYKEANRLMDELSSYVGGAAKAKMRASLLLQLQRRSDLQSYIEGFYKVATLPANYGEEALYQNESQRFHCFQAILAIAEACRDASQFDLARECLKKADHVRNLLAAGGSKNEFSDHQKNTENYILVQLSNLYTELASKDKKLAKKQAFELYQWWLKVNEADSKTRQLNMHYLYAPDLIPALLDTGLSEEANQVIRIVTPHFSRYFNKQTDWADSTKQLTLRLSRFKDDETVVLLLKQLNSSK